MGKIVVDGQTYDDPSLVPNMGSLTCVAIRGNQRDYEGFVQDRLLLPKYDNLATGSSATLVDPNGVEATIIGKYFAHTKQWIDLRGGVIV